MFNYEINLMVHFNELLLIISSCIPNKYTLNWLLQVELKCVFFLLPSPLVCIYTILYKVIFWYLSIHTSKFFLSEGIPSDDKCFILDHILRKGYRLTNTQMKNLVSHPYATTSERYVNQFCKVVLGRGCVKWNKLYFVVEFLRRGAGR